MMSDRAGLTALVRASVFLAPAAIVLAACGDQQQGAATADDEGIVVANVGFMVPESIVMDTIDDVYLVSNVNGSPTGEDGNGFISRLTPDGQVEELKWIDGEEPLVTLNAPKGMVLRGDSLFVTDIDCIRVFHRVTGEQQPGTCVDGSTFLNGIAVGPEGSLFVTDTGMREGPEGLEPTGTDAVYRLPLAEGRRAATVAQGADLGGPNGIAVGSRGIMVVTFRSGELLRFTAAGDKTQVMPPSPLELDGIVETPDGGLLFSSWGDSAIYQIGSNGEVGKVITGVTSPADIGFDAKRNRVLIPLFLEDRVVIRDLPPAAAE